MAAFERILSGIPEMDNALDAIRFGDNVVWQVTELKEFSVFMRPYVEQARMLFMCLTAFPSYRPHGLQT